MLISNYSYRCNLRDCLVEESSIIDVIYREIENNWII